MKRKGGKQRQCEVTDEIQGPAIVTALHVQDRETSKVAGSPKAWRKISPLENAYLQERLGLIDSDDAKKRLSAGVQYTELWDCAQSHGKDSTARFDLGRSSHPSLPLTERQRAAVARLVQTEMHLGQRDRTIIRAVCAWGHSPSEAMTIAKLPSDTRVSARLCEAMDALSDALERTAKSERHVR